jgi:lysophospholipase L1-like esterase
MPTRRTPLLVRLLFALALVFTIAGVIESAFIAYDLATGSSLSALRAPDLGRGTRSWTVHHAMRPGYDIPPTRINSFGLRSPEVAVPKPEGTFRVLLLGDSYTFGFMVGEDDVFARRLEARLRTLDGLPSAEVINAGVLSYCPLLEYLQYRHALHVLEPDLVILNFDMSDVQDHLEYSRNTVWSADGTPLYTTEPSLASQAPSAMPGLLSFEWVARKVSAARNRWESAAEGVPFARDEDRYLWTLDDGPAMPDEARRAMEPIGHLAALLSHHGIPFVLATYPQAWQVAAGATPFAPRRDQYGIGMNTVHLNDRPFRALEAFAAAEGVPFVNAAAAFRGAPEPAGLFLPDDFHFSPRGHDLYAQVLADYIANR